MIMDTNLVSASDLRRLTFGSYEQKIVQLKDSILAGVSEQIKVDAAKLSLIATFPDRAVVEGPNSSFYNVKLESSDDGSVHVVGVEKEKVEVIEPSRMGQWIESEVERAVDAWMKGDVSRARETLEGVLPHVPSTSEGDEAQVLVTVESKLSTPYRPWRRLYEERKSNIHRFVVNHFEALEATKLAPKYRKLYDGSIHESKLGGYEEIVENDLAIVMARYLKLSVDTTAAVDRARATAQKVAGSGDSSIQLYSGFAEDLVHDLAGVVRLAERATTRVGSVSGRGRLRDALAENLHQYEVASRFVVEVADRLTKAA